MKQKSVIILCGPTAVGKTALALALAGRYRTAIVSADSRQCFRELRIGVARPSDAECRQVPHYFIASHSIHDTVTAATFERYALDRVEELFAATDVVVMAGGTGLYIRAFEQGLDAVPETPPALRAKWQEALDARGFPWLQEQLKHSDPLFFEQGERLNPQRVMRALEVMELTGRSILKFRIGQPVQRPFRILKLGLDLPRNELRERIDRRVGNMMEAGWLDEVRELLPFQQMNALRTVGYRELFDHLSGHSTLEQALERIRIRTRQYAKRQLTWFRADPGIEWYRPDQEPEIVQRTDTFLQDPN
ncbi:MAG: tRNA ((37)-N6)-dimethylallyltransferase MiaA [Bacteroidota bacterium]